MNPAKRLTLVESECFLRKKGITDIEFVELDLKQGDNLSEAFRLRNPMLKVPVLELDDGTCISETGAICRYFEELYSGILLMGSNPQEKAEIEMWNRRMELNLMHGVVAGFRHTTGYFSDRETVVKEWGELNVEYVRELYEFLDQHLSQHKYIAGDQFSIADITALCALDFSKVIGLRVNEEKPHLHRWYQALYQRPSVKA